MSGKRAIQTQGASETKKKKLSLKDTLQARIVWRKHHKQPQIPYISNIPEISSWQKLVHPFPMTKSMVNLEVVKSSIVGHYNKQPSIASIEKKLGTKVSKYFADFLKNFWKCTVTRYVFAYDGQGDFGAMLMFSYNRWLVNLGKIGNKPSCPEELANLPAIAIADDIAELEHVLVYFLEDYKDYKQDEIWSYSCTSNKFHKIASSWEKLLAQIMTNEERNEYISMLLQNITDEESNKLIPFLNEGKKNENRLATCEVLNPHDLPRKHWAVVTHKIFGVIYFQPGQGWRGVIKKVEEKDGDNENVEFLLEGDLTANFTSRQVNTFKAFCSQKGHFLSETYQYLYEHYMEHFDGLGLEWGSDDEGKEDSESEDSDEDNCDNEGEEGNELEAGSFDGAEGKVQVLVVDNSQNGEDLIKRQKILDSISIVEVRIPRTKAPLKATEYLQ